MYYYFYIYYVMLFLLPFTSLVRMLWDVQYFFVLYIIFRNEIIKSWPFAHTIGLGLPSCFLIITFNYQLIKIVNIAWNIGVHKSVPYCKMWLETVRMFEITNEFEFLASAVTKRQKCEHCSDTNECQKS